MIEEIKNFSASLGSARYQGKRLTCLAFASSDLNQYMNGVPTSLSAEYLCHHAVKHVPNWSPNQGLHVHAALKALATPGQPEESLYPYQPNNLTAPLVAPASVSPLYTISCTKRTLTPAQIEGLILAEKAVCVVVYLSATFDAPTNGVVNYSPLYHPGRVHALVAVGVGTHKVTGETHILIRNSWGDTWGVSGHAWLPMRYLTTFLLDSFAL